MSNSMDYRGVDVSTTTIINPPTPIGGFMKYKGNWDTNLEYFIDDYVNYNRISYVALKDSQGSQPDTNPTNWQVVSYWSNPNNVSNYRGEFVNLLTMFQYDSILDPVANIYYVYLGTQPYITSTITDLQRNAAVLNNTPEGLPQLLQTPAFFGYTGNGTDLTGGLLFPFNTNPNNNIIETDLDIQTRVIEHGFGRSGSGVGTTTTLSTFGQYGKGGWYRVSCSIILWIYQNPTNRSDFYDQDGYLQILKIGADQSRTIIVRNQIAGPFRYNFNNGIDRYFPATMHLEGVVKLNFREGITLNCTNVSLIDSGWCIAPTMTITYLGPASQFS
jgi:hypothetical protein